MNQAERTKKLEQTLTKLLGKTRFTHHKRACTGDCRGYYDYSLMFEDGTMFFISMGRKYYLRNLADAVRQYQYFNDNREYLTRRTKEIIERDNRQAVSMGLSPIEFVSIGMGALAGSNNPFWYGIYYKLHGYTLWDTETIFFYACRGVGINAEKSVDAYFNEKVNRPDSDLGGIDYIGSDSCTHIFLGYLHR